MPLLEMFRVVVFWQSFSHFLQSNFPQKVSCPTKRNSVKIFTGINIPNIQDAEKSVNELKETEKKDVLMTCFLPIFGDVSHNSS